MSLKDMIFKRKSVRSYTNTPVDRNVLDQINAFISQCRRLYPEIRMRYEIVPRESVRCILPWIPPQMLTIFTEEREGALEDAGFVFQQLDLYLQSIGLGACWLGMGRLNSRTAEESIRSDGLKPVMMIAFGHPKGSARRTAAEFKRKALDEICDKADARLEYARLAPSSVNSQPWYFVHDGEAIHCFCILRGLLKKVVLGDMNRIDVGIALAHMCIAYPEAFRFYRAHPVPALKGYGYIGSFTL